MRKLFLSLVWITLGILAGMATSAWWLPPLIQREAVLWTENHGQRLVLGRIQVTPFPFHLRIEQGHLYEPDGKTEELGFGALDVVLSWRSLWHGMPVLDSVIVDRPSVHLARAEDGQWNVATLATSSSGGGGILPMLVENIRINNGEATVVDRKTGQNHTLYRIDMALPLLSTHRSDADQWVDLTLNMVVDKAPLSLKAQLQPWAAHWKMRGNLHWDEVDPKQWFSPVSLDSTWNVNGTVGLSAGLEVEEQPGGEIQAVLQRLALNMPESRMVLGDYGLSLGQGRIVVQNATINAHRMTLENATWEGDGWEFTEASSALKSGKRPDWHLLVQGGWSVTLERSVATAGEKGGWTVQALSPRIKLHSLNIGCEGERRSCQLQPWRGVLESLQGEMSIFRWPQTSGVVRVKVQGKVGREGHFSVAGPLTGLTGAGNLDLIATGIPLALAQRYVTSYARILVDQGDLAMKGKLSWGGLDQPWHIRYQGSMQIDDLELRDAERAQLLWKSKTFYLGGVDVEGMPLALSMNQVAISDFYGRLMLMPDGSLNLSQLLGKREQASNHPASGSSLSSRADALPASTAEQGPENRKVVPVSIHKITLQGGRVHYKDRFVHPMFEADLSRLGGRITGLSSQQGSAAVVDLRGRVNGAPLMIKGAINPLSAMVNMDLNAQVSGMDLSIFSPYSGKYVGYDIERGKLSFDVTYRIQDGHLNADNHLILNQLTFGKPVSSANAAHFPVELAASLLKDSQGNITVNLPIEGSLNDPQFSVGDVLAKTMVRLLEHALESPFSLLKRWLERRDSVSWLTFDPGSVVLGEGQQSRLADVLHSLQSQGQARLDLLGCVDREREGPVMQHQILMKKILAARRRANPRLREEQSPEAWPAEEYAHWLGQVYQAETFPKPKNRLGFDQVLSVADMEKLMLANSSISQGQWDHLAQQRVEVVQAWLIHHGISANRIYPVHESQQDHSIGQDVSHARVDCILHP